MATWEQVVANSNLIRARTERAVLIKLPKSELTFWHPRKLVRTSGKSDYRMTIAFTEEFEFKCFREGTGFKRQILEERVLTVEQFKKYFEGWNNGQS
jgi:hypothetical protein